MNVIRRITSKILMRRFLLPNLRAESAKTNYTKYIQSSSVAWQLQQESVSAQIFQKTLERTPITIEISQRPGYDNITGQICKFAEHANIIHVIGYFRFGGNADCFLQQNEIPHFLFIYLFFYNFKCNTFTYANYF